MNGGCPGATPLGARAAASVVAIRAAQSKSSESQLSFFFFRYWPWSPYPRLS